MDKMLGAIRCPAVTRSGIIKLDPRRNEEIHGVLVAGHIDGQCDPRLELLLGERMLCSLAAGGYSPLPAATNGR